MVLLIRCLISVNASICGVVNKRVIESLITCGAFDETKAARSQMTAVLEEALDYGQKVQRERCDPQMGLFDDGMSCGLSITAPSMPTIPEWDQKDRLGREKEALGFYISGHHWLNTPKSWRNIPALRPANWTKPLTASRSGSVERLPPKK